MTQFRATCCLICVAVAQVGFPAEASQQMVTNSIGMDFTHIPAGSFRMGDPFRRLSNDYLTVADVTITHPFLLGTTEVTQGQFKKVMGWEPWAGRPYTQIGEAYPAEWIRWREAELFCKKLTASERATGTLPPGEVYRLPTEAEWEYACRAGTQSLFPFGNDYSRIAEYGWTPANTAEKGEAFAHKVGMKKPNPWGLHDMLGNVSEWCLDFWDPTIDGGIDPRGHNHVGGNGRAVRGGSWLDDGMFALGAGPFRYHPGARSFRGPHDRAVGVGFRVVRAAADESVNDHDLTPPEPRCVSWQPAQGSQAQVYLGMAVADSNDGVVVSAVCINSPADVAGFLRDDVILTVQGRPVSQASDLESGDGHLLRPYERAWFKVRRQGETIRLILVPSGHQRLVLREVESLIHFAVPGVPAERAAAPANAIESLNACNVLTNAFIDRKTGEIEIAGHYDARFPTGPIPYLDLLKTAIKNPNPAFTLDPDEKDVQLANQRFAIRELTTYQPFSLEETYAGQVYAVVMGHSDAELDRQRLLRLHAREYGLSPEDFVLLRNHLFLDADGRVVPPEIAEILETVLTNLGYEKGAQAWAAVAATTANDAAARALQVLQKRQGDYPGSLRVQAFLALLDEVRPQNAGRWGGLVQDVAAGQMREEELVVAIQQVLLPEHNKARTSNIYVDMFSKLILSGAPYGMMADIPFRGVKVHVIPKALEPTSQMHRIFYEADYSLKSIYLMPELFPAAVRAPSLAAMWELEGATRFRQWLEPRKVAMSISDEKSEISFGEVGMELKFEITQAERSRATPTRDGGSRNDGSADDIDKITLKWKEEHASAYCRHVSTEYDAYAAVLPSFHELREAAKIVALARWINAESFSVDLDSVVQEAWNPPRFIYALIEPGFGLTYGKDDSAMATRHVAAQHGLVWFDLKSAEDISTIYPLMKWSGGVSFRENDWVTYESSPASNPRMPDALVVSNQIGQQAAQAALAGNLESARNLAELSAQAMLGKLTINELAKVNIRPERPATPPTAAAVRLHKELSISTYQQIEALRNGSTDLRSAKDSLSKISGIYRQVQVQPAAATRYLSRTAPIRQKNQSSSPSAPPVDRLAPSVDRLAWTMFEGGRFLMGSPKGEPGRMESEGQATVSFSRLFGVSRTEITQRDYKTVMAREPWNGQKFTRTGDDFPATWVTWFDAMEFCERLTQRGHDSGWLPPNEVVRLPTEAEWEYACRASEEAAYSFGDDPAGLPEYAWFLANTTGKNEPFAHRVATKKANAWRLYDMHGNVLEWCSDWYLPELLGGDHPQGPSDGEKRVARGGSWGHNPVDCRSATRFGVNPSDRNAYTGFRVVRSFSDK